MIPSNVITNIVDKMIEHSREIEIRIQNDYNVVHMDIIHAWMREQERLWQMHHLLSVAIFIHDGMIPIEVIDDIRKGYGTYQANIKKKLRHPIKKLFISKRETQCLHAEIQVSCLYSAELARVIREHKED